MAPDDAVMPKRKYFRISSASANRAISQVVMRGKKIHVLSSPSPVREKGFEKNEMIVPDTKRIMPDMIYESICLGAVLFPISRAMSASIVGTSMR